MLKIVKNKPKKSTPELATKPARSSSQVVDDYAEVTAQISQLEARKEELKQEIGLLNMLEIKGTLHRLVIADRPGRKSFDVKSAVKDGVLTADQEAKYTKVGAGFKAITVYGL